MGKEVDTLLARPAGTTIMGDKVTETVEIEEGKSEKYPWPLLVRTVLLLNAFLALGINDAMGGPTLLDLRDLVGTTIAKVSFIFVLSSIGSLVGCFLTGAFMDRIPNACYLFLASTLLLIGVANGSLPYSPSLFFMYAASFMKGLASGSMDTGGNVLLLRIWEGRDSGPYMHAIHFTFGIGAFLAPLISRPFLVNTEVAFGTFVSVFAVQSKLQFTRQQGSDVTAVFWGSFAATRGVAIFAAILASPK